MAKPAPTGNIKLDPPRLQNWLQRLGRVSGSAVVNNDPLSQLSLRKRDKRQSAALPSDEGIARRLFLRLLARRVLALSLLGYDPAQVYPLNVFAHPLEIEPDNPEYQAIAAEIEALPAEVLNGWDLASLQIWQGDSGRRVRKRTGSYYTPPTLAADIVRRTLNKPGRVLRVVDPACGGGVFLLAALDWLVAQNPVIPIENLIIGRLYGLDLNAEAIDLARLALLRHAAELTGGPLPASLLNLLVRQLRPGNALVGGRVPGVGCQVSEVDENSQSSVLSPQSSVLAQQLAALPIFNNGLEDGRKLAALSPFDWAGKWPEVFAEGGFSAVIGNPPYVGFNDYSGVEKAYFAYAYPTVYNLKSDLLYYFIARGVEVLRPGGGLGFVTSRFWKEAAFAAPLRRWLALETRLEAVEDFGGTQFFKSATVDTCLLFLEKGPPAPGHTFEFSFDGRCEQVVQATLDPIRKGVPWAGLRRQPLEEKLLAKITEQSCLLGEIADCRTGVQTGWDEVFFVATATAAGLEPEIVRPALKCADILPGQFSRRDLYLIYPPAEEFFDPACYPRLLAYLEPYRAGLLRRLRYDKPFPYYQLQWPRRPEIFEAPRKLVTPYKAPRNTFALDTDQLYFSTDVISVVFKNDQPLPPFDLEQFAVNFLNSRLSTFQFRSYSKPVGGGQYDYYANPVKRLAFPRLSATSDINLLRQLSRSDLSFVEINALVYELYELNPGEIELLEKY
jgi:hypothetical protein